MIIPATRKEILKVMLELRRNEISLQINSQKDRLRSGIRHRNDLRGEESIEESVDLTLMEMRSDTLEKLLDALKRLEWDTYGRCSQCQEEITEDRLRALPFAVRCKRCEEVQEQQRIEDELQRRRSKMSFLF